MNHETDANQPRERYKAEHNINTYRYIRVQRVKPDTASVWIVDRVGKQMIQIDQHGGHHQQITELPFRFEE